MALQPNKNNYYYAGSLSRALSPYVVSQSLEKNETNLA